MDVQNKEIVLAVFAGAVGLAGLLLVFQGFVVSAYTSLPAVTPKEIKRGHRHAVYGAFAAVVVAILSIGDCLYVASHSMGIWLGYWFVCPDATRGLGIGRIR